MADWLDETEDYGKNIGIGFYNAGKETVTGLGDLGKAGYKLATDPTFRQQTYDKATVVATQVGEVVDDAIADPEGAMKSMQNQASSAWGAYKTARAQAAAQGRLAEFDGQMIGGGIFNIVPVGKVAGVLGKAGKVISESQKLEKIGSEAVSMESKAAKAVKEAEEFPKSPIDNKTPCPLANKAETEPGIAVGETGANPVGDAAPANDMTPTSGESGVNPVGDATPTNEMTRTGGEPISMVTGEELLELLDFSIDGPLTLSWTRFYRTTQTATDLQLGYGWLTPLDEWLEVSESGVSYHDKEGRSVSLPLPKPGAYSLNLPEKIRLYREDGQYRLVTNSGLQRIFAAETGHCRLLSWQNQAGHSLKLLYDPQQQVQALQASWGKTFLLQREAGRITAIGPAQTGEQGLDFSAEPWVRYQYDAQGDLVTVLNRLNQGEGYAYRNHVIVRRTLASGFNFHFEWDRYTPQGRCLRNYGDHGIYDYRFEWTESGISRAIDSRGGVTEYMHDKQALLLWQISPEGRTTHYSYDENNCLISSTDANGAVSRYAYDNEGRLTQAVNALGQTTQLQYNAAGQLTALTDALGQVWRRNYDEQGRLTQTEDPQGGVSRYVYNELGLLAQVINPLNQTRSLLWDAQARLLGDIGFDGVRRRYQYDAEDHISAAMTQDKLTTQYQYDAQGRIVVVKAPDGAAHQLQYNAAGLVTQYTDAAGRVTQYRYQEGLSQISERIDPAGQRLRYQYDSERNLIGLTNAKGEHYRLNYDKDENLIEEIGFDGRVQRYRYDAAGHLQAYAQRGDAQLGQADWLVSQFQRDPLGRLLRKTSADGQVSEFAYDGLGRLQQAKNTQAVLHFHYNPLGQVIREVQNQVTVAHEYDALGRRTATIAPDGQRLEYSYDAPGRLQQIKLDGEMLSQHRFDELGLETRRQQGALVSRYDYDPMGRLLLQQAGFAGNNTASIARRYGYDQTGKLDFVDDFRHGQSRYHYDPADRLLQVEGLTPESFVHDPAGNLIGTNQHSGGLVKGDRLLMLGDRHFAYDAAGNLIAEKSGKDGRQVTRYFYDGDNRLIRTETPKGESYYRYDALGRRIAKLSQQGETGFVYDGARLLAETQGQCSRLYVFEPGSFRPLARIDKAGPAADSAVYYYHLDHLGTPREMTDSRGRVVWSGRYRAYGSLALADVAEVENPLRFQGQYCDAETGLHYNLQRYYDPGAGRFINQDPIGLAGGENLFRYAVNPVNWVDPLGLIGKDCLEMDSRIDPYSGIGNASQYLKNMGVPRNQRVQILQSFEAETVNLRAAGSSEYGLRYFDGLTAFPKGRYLFETFPVSRESVAVSTEWNQMTGLAQWKIRPNAMLIEGRAASQGIGLTGGQFQKFVPNLEDLLEP